MQYRPFEMRGTRISPPSNTAQLLVWRGKCPLSVIHCTLRQDVSLNCHKVQETKVPKTESKVIFHKIP